MICTMKLVYLTLIFFAVTIEVRGRSLQYNSSSNWVSDGNGSVMEATQSSLVLGGTYSSEDCTLLYNLLPCSYTVLGKLFLIMVYGFLYIIGESYVAAGGELIFEVNGTVGAKLFHVIRAIPDAIVLLVSGISVSAETAQSKVSIGVGLLVGSTVFYITAVWGICVYAGKSDIEGTENQDTEDTKTFSLFGSGVSTEIWNTHAARIMSVSIIPFVITQIPQVLNLTSRGQSLGILIALIVSVILTISYLYYEFQLHPSIRESRIAYVKHKQAMSGFLICLDSYAPGELLTSNGEPNEDALRKLFETLDKDHNGLVSAAELRALFIGIQSEDTDLLDMSNHVDNIMNYIDRSGDLHIDVEEFIQRISEWLNKANYTRDDAVNDIGRRTIKKYSFKSVHKETKQEHYMLLSETNHREKSVDSPKWTSFKAVMMLLVGTCIGGLVAEPLVDAVDDFSSATSIPTFFVSFVALPLATSCSETLSAIKMARNKTQKTVSFTLSELSVMVTLNNLLCLSVFLAIVYIKGLTWDFSAEVVVVTLVCVMMGSLTSFRTIFPLWTSLVAILLYPLSLTLVYVLQYGFGWS